MRGDPGIYKQYLLNQDTRTFLTFDSPGSEDDFGKILHTGRLTFGRKNNSMDGSRSMKFPHNVD